MGRATDFEYGANASQGSIADDLPACMDGLYCPSCGTFHGYCNETRALRNEAKRQGFEVLNSKQGGTKQVPKNNYKKLPFLKADNLPERGSVEMKITGNTRTFDGDYGLKINMDVEIKGKKYCFGIKPNNPGLRVIIDSLAARKAIKVERGDYNGNEYVQVCGVPERGN